LDFCYKMNKNNDDNAGKRERDRELEREFCKLIKRK